MTCPVQRCRLLLSDRKEDGSAVVVSKFYVKNVSGDHAVTNLRMTPIESFDFRLVEPTPDDGGANISGTFDLQSNEEMELSGYFAVLGDIRRGLCIRGDLQYDIQVKEGGDAHENCGIYD